ncbi:leucine--tRNA ligase [Candidatus Gottesmanbacteria bacterium]|nr:leucine--tRNA ligase [Candidatus Gottesmanbacteria bacterium]
MDKLKELHEQKLKPQEFESKWQEKWASERIYQPDLNGAKRPFYNLMMFPYPSAEGLHVGNVYAFTGADIYGRFQRMRGHDVFEPIGLDGFGIHSENYAIKIGKHPKEQAKISQKNFYRQLHSIGNGFAWENTVETYDPDYYRWTQWIFVAMFKHGLAYRKKSPVNFCPSCKTVLSDEQVIDGRCERCKSLVGKREMEQWFFKITDYAERLLQNTYKKEFMWPEKVKIGQRNWIGKKEGIIINYTIDQFSNETISCFTTRPDTNFGATFLVIAPEHELVKRIKNEKIKEIKEYVERAKKKTPQERIAEGREKTGVFTGLYCINQLNGYKMPLYISDFVLMEFGTGVVVGVPGHDKRDFEFAKKFNIPIKRVVVGPDGNQGPITKIEQVQEAEGNMINSGFLNGMDIKKAISAMMDHIEKKGWGKRVTTYKLRDWCISRQRYWGAPIPMINCKKCGWNTVPEKELPVLLPDLSDWKPEGTGKGPLSKLKDWVKVKCPNCGGNADRETDVCDTFLDSSWYHLRYPSVGDQRSKIKDQRLPWNLEITRKWLPVDQYIGGAEHTVLHLLYARFIWMAFCDWGMIEFDAKNKRNVLSDEPYSRFFAHGLLIKEGAKMSKSRGNVVVPDLYIQKYGADTLRTYLMFLGPFEAGGDFRDTGIQGMYKFLSRVWRLVNQHFDRLSAKDEMARHNSSTPLTARIIHKTIKGVTEDIGQFHYNTAIAKIMEYVNFLTDNRQIVTENSLKTLLLLLAPFAPHMTEELWQKYYQDRSKWFNSIHKQPWPEYDPKMLIEEEVSVVVQVNGKTRDVTSVQRLASSVQLEVEKIARGSEKVKRYLEGKKIKKVVFVPGKLINFVV